MTTTLVWRPDIQMTWICTRILPKNRIKGINTNVNPSTPVPKKVGMSISIITVINQGGYHCILTKNVWRGVNLPSQGLQIIEHFQKGRYWNIIIFYFAKQESSLDHNTVLHRQANRKATQEHKKTNKLT